VAVGRNGILRILVMVRPLKLKDLGEIESRSCGLFPCAGCPRQGATRQAAEPRRALQADGCHRVDRKDSNRISFRTFSLSSLAVQGRFTYRPPFGQQSGRRTLVRHWLGLLFTSLSKMSSGVSLTHHAHEPMRRRVASLYDRSRVSGGDRRVGGE
jgi:hypothetical protein